MGCQSDVILENNLTFSICTHDPDTGVLTDDDAVPPYLIYEDDSETELAISGNMVKHDAKTGFYLKKIACTAVNGFEVGKSYTIFIISTVGGDAGGITFGFSVKDKTGFALSAAGVDAIHDEEVDNDGTAISQRGAWKLALGILAGKSSGGGTATLVFRDINDAKNRISATVDANGNRTAVGTRDAT